MPVLSKTFLDIEATIESGFTLKRVRDMIRTHSQCIYLHEAFAKHERLDDLYLSLLNQVTNLYFVTEKYR